MGYIGYIYIRRPFKGDIYIYIHDKKPIFRHPYLCHMKGWGFQLLEILSTIGMMMMMITIDS